MRIDLEVLSSFDLIITTSASDSDCVSVSVNSNFGIRHTRVSRGGDGLTCFIGHGADPHHLDPRGELRECEFVVAVVVSC